MRNFRVNRRLLSNSATAVLSPLVRRYIIRQRDRLEPRSAVLTKSARSALQGFFSAAVLDRVRIVVSDPLPISKPPFSAVIRRLGFDFPSVDLTAAITFDHVIACREPMTPSLLFHELVHVVQYRLLGVAVFTNRYIQGFLSGGSYHNIPLERCAFELEARFVTGEGVFDVETEVAALIREKRF